MLLVLVLLACGTATCAQDASRTNTASAPLRFAKALPPLLPTFTGEKVVLPVADKKDLTLSLGAIGVKKVPPAELPADAFPKGLVRIEKDPFPNLHYVHLMDTADREVSRDEVGRIWKLSPRTTLLLPFGRWDNPGIEERITLGFCLKFRLK